MHLIAAWQEGRGEGNKKKKRQPKRVRPALCRNRCVGGRPARKSRNLSRVRTSSCAPRRRRRPLLREEEPRSLHFSWAAAGVMNTDAAAGNRERRGRPFNDRLSRGPQVKSRGLRVAAGCWEIREDTRGWVLVVCCVRHVGRCLLAELLNIVFERSYIPCDDE